jgi:hypothetical protein
MRPSSADKRGPRKGVFICVCSDTHKPQWKAIVLRAKGLGQARAWPWPWPWTRVDGEGGTRQRCGTDLVESVPFGLAVSHHHNLYRLGRHLPRVIECEGERCVGLREAGRPGRWEI